MSGCTPSGDVAGTKSGSKRVPSKKGAQLAGKRGCFFFSLCVAAETALAAAPSDVAFFVCCPTS